MSNAEAAKKISVARYKLVYERPYLANLFWAMKPVEEEGLGTLGVDKHGNTYYDPDIVLEWEMNQLTTVLYHESQHWLRSHNERREDRDPTQWNIAADCEINDDIIEEANSYYDKADWEFPGEPQLPSSYGFQNGLLAEAYYMKMMQNQQAQGGGNGEAGDESSNKTDVAAGRCGGVAGHHEEHETVGAAENQQMEQHQLEALRQQVAQDIKEAEETGQGHIPGNLSRWANERINPTVDWRKKLAALTRKSIGIKQGKDDYTYRRPSRRDMGNIILPSTVSPVITALVIIDTSGSMSLEMLQTAVAETESIVRNCGITDLRLIATDAHSGEVQRIRSASDINLTGGGGTDMSIPMLQAEELQPAPAIVIVMTDCMTPWPKRPLKKISTVICNVSKYENSYYSSHVPKWAHYVRVND